MIEKKNISIITANFYPEDTAIGLYTTQFAEFLSNEYNVTIATGFPYYPQWEIYNEYKDNKKFITENYKGISVIRYKQFVPKKVTIISRLKMIFSFVLGTNKNIKKIKNVDLVICIVPFTFSIIPAFILAKRKKAKLWIHVQDFEFDLAFESGIFKKNNVFSAIIKKTVLSFERFLLNKANLISSISFQMLKKVSEKAEKISTYYFPNWISDKQINPDSYVQHHYFNKEKFSLLYSGNIGEKQDWDLFCKVTALLEPHNDIEIIVVGDGGYLPTLKGICTKYNNIKFEKLVPFKELNDLLCSASCHFLFQKPEVLDTLMPSKLLGMMASEKPCIVSGNSKSEVAKVLTAETGIYITEPSANEVYEKILLLKNNAAFCAEIGKKARVKVVKKFSKEYVLNDFKKAIDEILQNE